MRSRFGLRWLSVVVLPPVNVDPAAARRHGTRVSEAGS